MIQNYKDLRRKTLQDDLKNMSSKFVEERQYLESELASLNRKIPTYFTDYWNYVDLTTYLLIFILIVLHIVDIFFHSVTLALWVARY